MVALLHSNHRRLAVAAKLAAIYGLILVVLVHTPITEWLARPLVMAPGDTSPSSSDAIVLLGAWATASGDQNESGLRRTIRAAELYRRGVSARIVVTGSGPTSSDASSSVVAMVKMLQELGVPQSAIESEEHSHNTHDSAVNVSTMLRPRGVTHVTLVTDAAHQRRALGAFRKAGFTVEPAFPAPIWDLGSAHPSARLGRVATLAHEYGGLAYYWWRGWI